MNANFYFQASPLEKTKSVPIEQVRSTQLGRDDVEFTIWIIGDSVGAFLYAIDCGSRIGWRAF